MKFENKFQTASSDFKKFIVDTPNLIFRGRVVYVNKLGELLNLASGSTRTDLKLIITPKMEKEAPWLVDFLAILSLMERNIILEFIETNKDADSEILSTAINEGITVVSNDKFRQKRYHKLMSCGIPILTLRN